MPIANLQHSRKVASTATKPRQKWKPLGKSRQFSLPLHSAANRRPILSHTVDHRGLVVPTCESQPNIQRGAVALTAGHSWAAVARFVSDGMHCQVFS